MLFQTSIVTLVMFVVYTAILSGFLRSSIASRPVLLVVAGGVAFGLLSYGCIVAPLNSIEAFFMNNRGPLHVLFIGPIQEEFAKFVNLLLASTLITQRLGLSDQESSQIRRARSVVILGAFVGLAFAVTENLIDYDYLTTLGIFRRTLVSWPLHMVTVCLSAYGFFRFRQSSKIGILVGLLSGAIFIHIIFNVVVVLLGF